VAADAVEVITKLCSQIELSTDQSTWKGQGDVAVSVIILVGYVHFWKRDGE